MLVLACAVLGALLGVWAPGPAYRLSVPSGEPARRTCAQCAGQLRGGLSGWARLSARCPYCATRFGITAWATALAGAATFAGLAWALGAGFGLVAFLLVAGYGLVLAPIDLACMRLPDPLVGTAFVATLAILTTGSILDGSYWPLARALTGAVAMFVGYLILALLPGAVLGFGDVKLAGVLGLVLGYLGWVQLVMGALLPLVINGPVALVLLLSGRVRRDSHLPLGPAMLVGAVLAAVLDAGWRRWLTD
jgi:leader peptidase (prepilin peptidase)/N-methyltransferase